LASILDGEDAGRRRKATSVELAALGPRADSAAPSLFGCPEQRRGNQGALSTAAPMNAAALAAIRESRTIVHLPLP
jgi:hypothetical protein